MRIAVLQNSPRIGHVDENIEQANRVLASNEPREQLDLLVLPELAFTGYNFPDLASIKPYLEPTAAGVSTIWAISVAQRLKCHVIVGYPEISAELDHNGTPINYNSTVTIGPTGAVLATYRKSFLYYTDESWAAEGSGFYHGSIGTLGSIAHGICMDVNPKEFTAPWDTYEFANHCLTSKAKLIVLSTAWLTHTPLEELQSRPTVPDASTVSYWIERLSPLLDGEDHTVVFANRCGSERNQIKTILTKNGKVIELEEDFANFAGTSCVLRFSNKGVMLHGLLGQYKEGFLVVDTSKDPMYMLSRESKQDVLDE